MRSSGAKVTYKKSPTSHRTGLACIPARPGAAWEAQADKSSRLRVQQWGHQSIMCTEVGDTFSCHTRKMANGNQTPY